MSMMSIESIENDASNETGSFMHDRARIEEIYKETITLLVTKYHESDLCNDHKAKHPECFPIEDSREADVYTGFCY